MKMVRKFCTMREARPKDLNALIHLLSPLFITNLSVNQSIKQDRHKTKRIRHLIKYACKISIRNHSAFMGDSDGSAMLCVPSNGHKATLLENILFILKASGLQLARQIIQREHQIKGHHPEGNFYHLWFIGVKNDVQRSGEGSKLINDLKEKCQDEQRPIYLETSSLENIAFYKRNGFTCYRSVKLQNDPFYSHFFFWKPNND